MTVSELPPVDPAMRSQIVALVIGVILAFIGYFLWMAALNDYTAGWGSFSVPALIGYLAAALFVAAGGLISAGIVGRARLNASSAAPNPVVAAKPPAPKKRRRPKLPRLSLGPEAFAGWAQVLVAIFLGGVACAAVVSSWNLPSQPALTAQAEQIIGGLLIVLAFPFLVLERVYANTSSRTLPEAPQIERLLRVPLASFVGFGITSVLRSVGFEWPTVVENLIAIMIALVALELVLRGLAMIYLPFAPISERRSVADSTIASLLRLTWPRFSAFGTAVKRQFGIDLSRSWALAFVRRAAPPIGLGMVVFAWCMTGVTTLGINERAVYERFGVPVSVDGPGLHVHLPWPFGIMRTLELGVVHEIPIVFAGPGETGVPVADVVSSDTETTIEGPAPASADRLWDQSHPSEASYLVASETQGKQSFQVVNVDLRVVYRIGLSDTAAKQAAYAISDPEALIRAKAGELLVRYFARYTLLDVLGQSRERFTNDFRVALQNAVQDLPTGIEVIAVVVEAIHPPPDAASAYHDVQATAINASSQISLRRADAIGTMESAQQTATEGLADAAATAAETVDQAQAESVLFQGDRQAYQRDGQVFLFERWLDRLSSSLPKSSFIVLDSRLKGATAPTIDLRGSDQPGTTYRIAPPAPANSAPPPQEPQSQDEENGDD